jgi:hypothetical protein
MSATDEQPTGLTEEEAFHLVCYLVSSAELAVIEPDLYGTFRLVDAASRLLENLIPRTEGPQHEFYASLKAEIDDNKMLMVWDHGAYIEFLRRLPVRLVEGLQLRSQPTQDGAT